MFITIIAILGIGIALLVALLLLTDVDLSSEDGSALVRGRKEEGYPYVGYLISDKSRVCTATLLDSTTILTAGHCLNYNAGERFSFGMGEFDTDTRKLTPVKFVRFAPGYNPDTDEGADLAIATLGGRIELDEYPQIGRAIEKCDASIVAYGAGITDQKATEDMFMKKTGEGCIKSITSNFLIRFDSEVGMCFGDSGDPIFKSPGSNEIIGVLTSGLVEVDLKTIKCDPGNTGLAITTDYFVDFIEKKGELGNDEVAFRVLDEEQVKDLTQRLREFVVASEPSKNNSNTGSTVSDHANNTAAFLLIAIATLTLILIVIASRIRNVF